MIMLLPGNGIIQNSMNSIRGILLYRRLQWFDLQERMEDNFWSSKCKTFKISCSFPREMKRNMEVNVL